MHGWGGSLESLMPLALPLSKEFRVTLVDFYGFGNTPHPNYPLCLNDYLSGVADIINHYKMSHVILIGHSFGGRVAILASARYSHLFDKIVLIDSAGIKPKRKPSYYLKVFKVKVYRLLGCKRLPKGSADYQKLNGAMKRSFVNIVNYHLNDILKYITLPVLLIYGENDKDTPIYMAKKLKKGIRKSKLCILKNAGHFSYLDSKYQCLAEIKQFIGGTNHDYY